MNAQKLCKAIVVWLEFEELCDRGHLLSEASLTVPISQFLISTQSRKVVAEVPYPDQQKRRGAYKQMDFALYKNGEQTVAHLIESKLITDKRDFKAEVLEDVLRLESANFYQEEGRWLVVAGKEKHVYAFQVAQVHIGGGKSALFTNLLPFDPAQPKLNARVADADEWQRKWWEKSAKEVGLTELPLSITVRLAASCGRGGDPEAHACIVWQIQSVRNRSTRKLS